MTNGAGSVIITGGNGFVGKYLQQELAQHWPDAGIVSWDLPEVDITKPETYREQMKILQPKWLVHLAAVSAVGAAEGDPGLARVVNVEATQKLLKSTESLSAGTRTLVASSSEVYGASSPTPLVEMPLEEAHPSNTYGETKLEMERMIEARFAGRCIRVRPFPHIGPGQGLGFVTADFASQIARVEKGLVEPVMYVGNLEARRDFTDVRDVVRAYRLLMEQGKMGEVYHVASGKAVSIQFILDSFLGFSSADISVEQDEARMRPSDTPILVGDAGRLKQATGWSPTISLEDSLRDILAEWRRTV